MIRPTITQLSLAFALAAGGIASLASAARPAWAQTAEFDDTEAQLRVRQAATAAGTAARKVESLRQELEAERHKVVQTEGERELNQAAVKALEQELVAAEARKREQDAALAAAQDARTKGVAAEAERRQRENALRPQAPPPPPVASTPPPPATTPPTPPPPAGGPSEALELAAWNSVATSPNPAMIEAFLTQFPRSVFAPMARVRLDELKAQGTVEAARRGEAESRRLAEEEARRKAEAGAAARRDGERDEAALRLGDRDRQRIQVALTALGFNTAGTDGVLGPRSREMIAAWQKARNQPATGFVTAAQQQQLQTEAAPALAKHEEEQKRLEEDRKKAEAEARAKAQMAAVASPAPAAPPAQAATSAPAPAPAPAAPPARVETKPAPQQALAAPSGGGSAPGFDGTYSGMVTYSNGTYQRLSITVVNGVGTGSITNPRCGKIGLTLKIEANGSASMRIDGYDARCMSTLNTHPVTVVANQLKAGWQTGMAGRAELSLTRQ